MLSYTFAVCKTTRAFPGRNPYRNYENLYIYIQLV
jgi:hypothetical protein